MKDIQMQLLYELMKDSRRSDRELSKILKVSQPTVSRTLKKMQKDLGLRFTAAVNLGKVGFELIAVTFGRKQESPIEAKKVQEFLEEFHNTIVFASTGTSSGINADRMIISLHKDYSDYFKFRERLRASWEGTVLLGNSFLMSLQSDKIIRQLSTHYLFEPKEATRASRLK